MKPLTKGKLFVLTPKDYEDLKLQLQKQTREEIIKEIKKDIVIHKNCRFYHQYRNKQLSCLDIVLLDINRKLRQLDKEGK